MGYMKFPPFSKSKLPLPLGCLRWLQYFFHNFKTPWAQWPWPLFRNLRFPCAPNPRFLRSFLKWIFHEFYRRKWPSNISIQKHISKHFNKQIIHGTLTSLSKKHSSAYRVEDKRKVLLSHHLGLTEEMLPLMRIIYRLSLREGIISVAWTDDGAVKHQITKNGQNLSKSWS